MYILHNPTAWMITLALIAGAVLYVIGCVCSSRFTIRPQRARLGAFAAGWFTLLLAFNSPLEELAEQRFWSHMTQHELLMLVAAPLLVAARPLPAMLAALPVCQRRAVAGLMTAPAMRAAGTLIFAPLAAWSIHAIALWVWHAP